MESWRQVWRQGFAPAISTKGLVALRDALESDDPRLLQGATTMPPPLECVQDWPCEGACLIALTGWLVEDGAETVGEVEEYYARKCFDADQLLGEPAGCRHLLNWFDDTPRDEMRAEMLAEVILSIAGIVES